jgi:hypothetical protein
MIDQILQNTSDKIEVDIYFNNVLTTPTSITIRQIIDPDGTIILQNVVPSVGTTVGRYEYTIPAANTSKLGVYTAYWRFVIDGSTYEHTQYFEVVSSIRTGYISPYDLRQLSTYYQITDTVPTDEVLQKYIDRSTVIINSYLGDSINYGIYSEKRRCVLDKVHNGIHIQLSHKPIISLTSVLVEQEAGNSIDLDVTDFRINENAGYIEYFRDISRPSLKVCSFDPTASQIIPVATVVYTAGYVTVPDAIKTAAAMIIEELYKETNGEDKQLVRFTIDQISEQYSSSETSEALANQLGLKGIGGILKLLNPYRQPYKTFPFAGPLG